MSPTGMMGRKCEVLGTGSLKMAVPMSAFGVDCDEDVQGDFWMMMVSITAHREHTEATTQVKSSSNGGVKGVSFIHTGHSGASASLVSDFPTEARKLLGGREKASSCGRQSESWAQEVVEEIARLAHLLQHLPPSYSHQAHGGSSNTGLPCAAKGLRGLSRVSYATMIRRGRRRLRAVVGRLQKGTDRLCAALSIKCGCRLDLSSQNC